MKTKLQKTEDLKQGAELLNQSQAVLFVDFAKVKTADLKNLRRELKQNNNPLVVLKKRLLGLALKQKGIEFAGENMKTSVGTVFASNLESAAGAVYKFFQGLETEKKIEPAGAAKKILGGYDLTGAKILTPAEVLTIGKLPPRAVLLAQLLGLLATPIRSLLYLLQEKSKQKVAE